MEVNRRHDRSAGSALVSTPDRGFTLIELLVTIVLMGTTVVAVLAGMQTTIRASTIDRNHATIFEWLQSASDEIYQAPRIPCTAGRAAAITAYDEAAKLAPVPPVWEGTAARIDVVNVEYLGRLMVDDAFEWDAAFCFEGVGYENSPLYTQRVTIRAVDPNGSLVQTIEMVKSQ